jgi:DNA-binding response OmpR family regulator
MDLALPASSGIITVGPLEVDPDRYRASLGGRALTLSRSQVELLAILLANAHRVISRHELSSALGLARGRSVDVLLSGLRREIGGPFVRNVRNRGWIVDVGALEVIEDAPASAS